jgi:formyltetrahydrofolate-dependent phosphoribosylglycinamide formyltransferase
MKKRIVVMISGNGSNLQAIIDAIVSRELNAEIVLVVSNRKNAYGLTRAAKAGIESLYFPLKPYKDRGQSREGYDIDLARRINGYKPDLVVLAGWMLILSKQFLDTSKAPVINLHPALPGQFAGTHAIERAFEAYQRGEIVETGCMVHVVVPEVDAGPVIAQRIVPIQDDDTLELLETRMHQNEHRLIVQAIRQVLQYGLQPKEQIG